jgi:hypothetical protein
MSTGKWLGRNLGWVLSSGMLVFLLTLAYGQGSRDTRQDERIDSQTIAVSDVQFDIANLEDDMNALEIKIARAEAERYMMLDMLNNIHECLIGPYDPFQEVGEN